MAELLQRAAWDYREVLAEKQRLARTVEELTQQVHELTERAASHEKEAAPHKEPDELARFLLASAQRTAREEREAARQECELMLKKAARRAKEIEDGAAGRAAELARDLATTRRNITEEFASAQEEAEAALAEARRELARLEAETAMLRSLRTDAERRVAEFAQSTLEKLEALGVGGGRAEDDLLDDLQLP